MLEQSRLFLKYFVSDLARVTRSVIERIMKLYGPNAIPVPITDFIQTFEDKIAFPGWITVFELILMDKGYDIIISNISKLIILDVSYSSDYNYNILSIKISSKTVIHPGKAILSSNVWIKSVMGTGIAFRPYNVIIMRSITDRVTRAKSDKKKSKLTYFQHCNAVIVYVNGVVP